MSEGAGGEGDGCRGEGVGAEDDLNRRKSI